MPFTVADALHPDIQRPSTDENAVNPAQAVVPQIQPLPAAEPALAIPQAAAPNALAEPLEVFLSICFSRCFTLRSLPRVSAGFRPFVFAGFLCLVIRTCFSVSLFTCLLVLLILACHAFSRVFTRCAFVFFFARP